MLAQHSILNELRKAEAQLAAASDAVSRHPGDFLLEESMRSFASHVERLREAWESECAAEKVEVCKYRVIKEGPDFDALDIGGSITKFQDLFSHLHAALQRGPRESGRLPQAIKDETGLKFGYSYAGSLGIAFYLPAQAKLFEDGFDDTVLALHQVFDVQDEFELRDMARKLGKSAVLRIKEWASVHERAGFEVDINWRNAQGETRGGYISSDQIHRLRELIDITSDTTITEQELQGKLLGLDVAKRKFNFRTPQGEFNGTLGDSFDVAEHYEVNAIYRAKIVTSVTVFYGRDDKKVVETLEALDILDT